MRRIKKGILIFLISIFLVIGISYSQTAFSQAIFPEIRGVWLTKNENQIISDKPRLKSTLQELARLNFNTIYPVVWNSGYASYPSQVVQKMGIQSFVHKGFQNQDTLAEMVHQGHKNGLLVIPWFEFGFMTPPTSELAVKYPQWLTTRRDGSKIGDSAAGQVVWLNPFHPQVQKFMTDLVLEVCTKYQVDGIQFDDHLALPVDFGYDPYTKALYQQETKRNPPTNPQDKNWLKWRADKITDFMTRLNNLVKQQKPNLIFSVAPNPYSTAYNSFLQDWKKWIEMKIVDELIVQVYRPNLNSFLKEIRSPEIQYAQQNIPTGIAILTGLRNNPTPINLIEQKIRQARNNNLGISFFYYETLWQNKKQDLDNVRKSVIKSLFSQPQPRR